MSDKPPGNDDSADSADSGKAKPKGGRRRRAREAALQALYQQQLTGHGAKDLIAQFDQRENVPRMEDEFFRGLILGIEKDRDSLETLLDGFCDRPLAQLDPIEKAILWIGAYELTNHPEVPYRVVVNEAVELSHRFGAQDGHKFVNAVLDRAARKLRAVELRA